MSDDIPRHIVEGAVGLLKQGQHRDALYMLEDALAGRVEPPPTEDSETLELAFEDETPEIPHVRVEHGEVYLEDDGWSLDGAVVRALKDAGKAALMDGKGAHGAEAAIREVLYAAVRAGKVQKL